MSASMSEDEAYEIAYGLLERYAANAGEPKELSLYLCDKNEAISEVPLGSTTAWREFATWGAEQGGELARLAHEGHSDPYRLTDALADLKTQLTDVPYEHKDIAAKLLEAIRSHPDAEGLWIEASGLNMEEDHAT